MIKIKIGPSTTGRWRGETIYVHRRGGIEAETLFTLPNGEQLVKTTNRASATFRIDGGLVSGTTLLRPYKGSTAERRRATGGLWKAR